MEFESISLYAYNENDLPQGSTLLEQVIYYKLKELYIKHYKGNITKDDAEIEKQKLKTYFEQEKTRQKLYENINKKCYENLSKSEDLRCKIGLAIINKTDSKDILDLSIQCISLMVDDDLFYKNYKEKY